MRVFPVFLPSTEGTAVFASAPTHALVEPDNGKHNNDEDYGSNHSIRHVL